MVTFTFDEQRVSSLSIAGSPILVAGPLVELCEGCTVVLPSLEHVQKPNPEHRPPQGEYDMPRASAFMLDNCETESAHWVIKDRYGIVRPEESAALQEKCRALREMNERRFEDGVLVENTNWLRQQQTLSQDVPRLMKGFTPGQTSAMRWSSTSVHLMTRWRCCSLLIPTRPQLTSACQ